MGAFRVEVALPGAIDDALDGTFKLTLESERVSGVKSEDTPAGWPRAHVDVAMKRSVPSSMSHLRYQRGYNKWFSPWIVALADVRASEKWVWPAGADKSKQGCDRCDRPPFLENKLEPEVMELYSAGRVIAVRPEAAFFAGTPYEYMANAKRLENRVATVPADTLRPTEVQIAAH